MGEKFQRPLWRSCHLLQGDGHREGTVVIVGDRKPVTIACCLR